MNIFNVLKYFKGFLSVARSLLVSQYALMLEYRVEIILWAISGILPLIMLGIWKDAGISSNIGLDGDWISKYFISAFVVRQFTAVWVMFSFEEDNIEGRLSPYLLQPINPFWRYYFSHIAEQISRFPIVLVLTSIVFLLLPDSLWLPSISSIILFFIAVFSAFTVRFLLHWVFAMICFWTDRASALERLLLVPYLFLSGLVAPLESFPTLIRKIAYFTPFPYILSFPAKILAGQKMDMFISFSVLYLWGLLFYIIGNILWNAGLRNYSAMGS
ncbi:ABC transporter permease [Prochlorococcus sp. MIT 1307]|uniref:ABC transporter permease n=1 Tax=Prochlorococcus sp. MIT 1307 TaxID=3096219 RepID=UPI002A7602EC|nr:ABC-2 family transporter protein [Prochlorococcus sp. MIT 1307]